MNEGHVVGLQGGHVLPLRCLAVQVALLEGLEPRQHGAIRRVQQVSVSTVLVKRIEGVVPDGEEGGRREGAAVVPQHLKANGQKVRLNRMDIMWRPAQNTAIPAKHTASLAAGGAAHQTAAISHHRAQPNLQAADMYGVVWMHE
jgi:hypothetical protein